MRSSVMMLLATIVSSGMYAGNGAAAQSGKVVENGRPVWRPRDAPPLSTAPVLVVGTRAGDMYEFTRVVGAARVQGGQIVVADGGSSSLRIFDSTGAFVKSIGRRGEGPGEFQRLDYFAVMRGDTLVAGARTGDLSWFTGTGRYLERRGVMNPRLDIASAGMPVVIASLDGSGSRLVAAMVRPMPRADGTRWVDSVPVEIVDGKNAVVRVLGRMPMMEMAETGGQPRESWFSATAVAAGDGRFLYWGYGSRYTIDVYGLGGDPVFRINRAWTASPVTRTDIENYVTEWGKRWIKTSGAQAEAERASLRAGPYARTVPAFSQFIVDHTGRLWVREAHLADAPGSGGLATMPLVPSRWSVFDSAGRWLGDVTMPARFQPTDIGSDYVLGIAADADGVETVALYRFGDQPG